MLVKGFGNKNPKKNPHPFGWGISSGGGSEVRVAVRPRLTDAQVKRITVGHAPSLVDDVLLGHTHIRATERFDSGDRDGLEEAASAS